MFQKYSARPHIEVTNAWYVLVFKIESASVIYKLNKITHDKKKIINYQAATPYVLPSSLLCIEVLILKEDWVLFVNSKMLLRLQMEQYKT